MWRFLDCFGRKQGTFSNKLLFCFKEAEVYCDGHNTRPWIVPKQYTSKPVAQPALALVHVNATVAFAKDRQARVMFCSKRGWKQTFQQVPIPIDLNFAMEKMELIDLLDDSKQPEL